MNLFKLRTALAVVVATSMAGGLWAPGASASSPYPSSSFLSGISFSESSKLRYAAGSDLWESSWASNGNLVSIWGDGTGFSGSTKVEFGVSTLAGNPTSGSITGSDDYYGTPNGTACGKHSTIGGKGAGAIALPEGVVYAPYWDQDECGSEYPEPSQLAKSTNNGTSWSVVSGVKWPDSHKMIPEGFMQYGEAQAGALEGYVYLYMHKTTDTAYESVYLARMTPANVGNQAEYSWFKGLEASGNPEWGAEAEAAAVFKNSEKEAYLVGVYDPGIGRYLVQTSFGAGLERDNGVFDGPTPWGPWTTVVYQTNFDNTECGSNCLGEGVGLSLQFPQKWINGAGLGVWGVYSSDSTGYDSLNLINGTMSLASGSTIKKISLSTGAAAVTDSLSTSAPGSQEYIDSGTLRFTKIASYSGDEMIRLPNADKNNKSSNYLEFTINKAENVCVGYPSTVTPPSWLSSWTETSNTLKSSDGTLFDVFDKSYAANAVVTLGGAANTSKNMVVFVGC